jgi:hypothetical protein
LIHQADGGIMNKTGLRIFAVLWLAAATAGQLKELPKPRPFFVPRLIITDLKVSPSASFYLFTLSYKNVGTGSLPKVSDMAVRPDFRVLIDGREINHGFLYIPDTVTGPGWENSSFVAARVPLGDPAHFDYAWFLGNMVTVKINENQALASAADSQTYNLRAMALIGAYDLMITGAGLDWAKEILTVNVRVEGITGNVTKFQLFENSTPFNFEDYQNIVPGQRFYTITRKLTNISYGGRKTYSPDLLVLPRHGDKSLDVRDIDHRNNEARYTFNR